MGAASSNRPDTAGPGPGPDKQIAPKTGHCSILLLSCLDCMYVLVLQVSGSRWYYCFTVFPPIFLFWVRVNGLQCDLLVTGTCRRRQMYHLEEGKKISGKKKRREEASWFLLRPRTRPVQCIGNSQSVTGTRHIQIQCYIQVQPAGLPVAAGWGYLRCARRGW